MSSSPSLRPPVVRVDALRWLRENLFSGPINTALTLVALYLLWRFVPPVLGWLFFDATWQGSSRADCHPGGACWIFIGQRFGQFLYGFYPAEERWRVNLAALSIILLAVPLFFSRLPQRRRWAIGYFLFTPVLVWWLLYGAGILELPTVSTDQWGGLMLTLVIAAVGIAGALPLGILLALGLRSQLPAIKIVCITFIEFWRGVPLITVLFMSSVMLPLFLPEQMSIDKLVRALIAVILFEAAYLAEVVRGGLQAIPKGQYEAAHALGLSYWQSMGLVILPQALRLVIPGIVNTFIALFKDTSLVIIIGLADFFTTVHRATVAPEWLGFSTEGYVFAAFVYFLFCFGMSRYSIALEKRLARSEKR